MVACEHTTWCKTRRTGRTSHEALIPFLLVALWALPASAFEITARWGCPTAEGPAAIAEAFASGVDADIGNAAIAHKCSRFPYPVAIKPVNFVGMIDEGGTSVYTWEVSFESEASTFFTNFSDYTHKELTRRLGEKI